LFSFFKQTRRQEERPPIAKPDSPNEVSAAWPGPARQRKIETTLVSKETTMKINWRHDVATAFDEARTQRKPMLLDFSAAPM
jgi:hypothetical protein